MQVQRDNETASGVKPDLQGHLVALAALAPVAPMDWESALTWLYQLIRWRVANVVGRGWFVEDAEDLVQDLVIEMIPAVRRYVSGRQGIGAFLTLVADLKIMSRCKRMLVRRRRIQPGADLDSLPHPATVTEIDARLDFAELLTRLSLSERDIMQLLLAGHTPQTLAERWGVSPDTARQRCHRARVALRVLLPQLERDDPTPAAVGLGK